MSPERADFLVIGSGLAGLSFALRAAEKGEVAVLTKANLFESNTSYAQGGIAAAVGESDSWQLHEVDTLRAGGGTNDPAAVRFLVQQAPAAVRWLISLGAQFDQDDEAQLELGREGGHSRNRIVHHADKTGWEIERAMTEAVRRHPRIRIYENAFAARLLAHEGRCVGTLAHLDEIGWRTFLAPNTLLATGGCGKLYQHTTNPRIATGDGVALADGLGAQIVDMEFIQFHPTTLFHPQLRGFLITEAVRGAGGTLRTHLGRRFMFDFDDRLELAPRDVVARAIVQTMQKLDTWCVYLDTTHLPAHALQDEFPTIWEKLRSVGIEIEKEWIPVVPAQHYSCGGVVTDLLGRTTVPGLYAAGEVAATGVHGANRLASNSLLEAIVFSAAAAEDAGAARAEVPAQVAADPPKSIVENEAIRIRHALQSAMTQHVGVLRTTAGLRSALARVEELTADYAALPEAPTSRYSLEAQNLLVVARHVVRAALARTENVGLHYNLDLARKGAPTEAAARRPAADPAPTPAT